MKNVTITMDDADAEWIRIEAAKRNSSVSRMLGELVAEMRRREDAYERAMRDALKFESFGTSLAPPPGRETLYDRPGLR